MFKLVLPLFELTSKFPDRGLRTLTWKLEPADRLPRLAEFSHRQRGYSVTLFPGTGCMEAPKKDRVS